MITPNKPLLQAFNSRQLKDGTVAKNITYSVKDLVTFDRFDTLRGLKTKTTVNTERFYTL